MTVRMVRLCLGGAVVLLGVIGAAGTVTAHHSFAAEYDRDKPVKITGAVTKVEWTNPHAHVYIDVAEANGTKTNWNFEMASPNVLERNGWSRRSLSVNDEVTLEGYGGRAVTTRGIVNAITLANGKALFSGAGPGSEYSPGR